MTQRNLQTLARGHSNNLNALRLALALWVVLSHCLALSGFPNAEPLLRWTHGQQTFGGLAVDLFFFISGLLITASWPKSKSMNDYLRRRVLRIFRSLALRRFIAILDFLVRKLSLTSGEHP